MSGGGYIYQCQCCGGSHIEGRNSIAEEDELFVKLKCPHCRQTTQHLWCGENETDYYTYYNSNLDPRIYKY